MDLLDYHPEVLSSERSGQTDFALEPEILSGPGWIVRPLPLTPTSLNWLWTEMSKHRTLFSDFTRGDAESFINLVLGRDTFWLLVTDETNQPTGVFYISNMLNIIDYDVHMMFFDRELDSKVEVCQAIARWLFNTWPLTRLTATVPVIYFRTKKLIQRVGFKLEGTKRNSILIGGRYVDEAIYGLLQEELD